MKEFLKFLYAASPLMLQVSNTIYSKSRKYGIVISISVSIFFLYVVPMFGLNALLVTIVVFAILVVIGYIYTATY